MGASSYDFCGWATRNNLRCADGRIIRQNAFAECDGKKVPLVYNHSHDDPSNVIGHALLENKEDGMYMYGYLNDTQRGQDVKIQIQHGDITGLSIYANHLTQKGSNVMHGIIREVSVVLAGANPGAYIEDVLVHGEEDGETAIIYSEEQELYHSDEDDYEDDEDYDEDEEYDEDDDYDEEEYEDEVTHSDDSTVGEIFDTLNDEQKKAVYFVISNALKHAESEGGDNEMKHNIFEGDNTASNVLSHDDMKQIFADAKRLGSLRDAVEANLEEGGALAHAVYNTNPDGTQGSEQTYGIADINWLFPDARTTTNTPEFIKRQTEWVATVMNGTHHTPFSRIKSVFANITMDEARAKGYIKGNLKKEEVFSLLKRTTDPQTIYKKQKLDRDDIIDITDFDVVAWIKGEMRLMLDEEIARAILIGDGRLTSDDDHISEDHIRPIWKDAALYTIRKEVERKSTDSLTAKAFIDTAIRARKEYKGSGSPTLFTTADMLTEMLLIEDGIGHKLYKSKEELATTLRVSKIVEVEVMENQVREGKTLAGIIVNLNDYNVGADKGGAVAMFDDFDIDYNQQKYLIETRISGALTKPYSAIVLELGAQQQAGGGEG